MSTSALTRKRGKKRPPTELLAAAMVIYQNQELTREELPGVMRRAAHRMGLDHKLPEKLHFYTIYRWAKWGLEGGLTLADAGPLFQIIREGEEEGAEL